MKNKLFKMMVSLLVLTTLISCATIMGKSGPETLNVRSTPDQANVTIIDELGTKIFEGKTPVALPLEKKKGYFKGKKYTVKIQKEGYAEQTVTVDTRLNGWYIGGNIILGGLIGWLIVDPATGAMWTLDSNEINVTLETSKHGAIIEPNKIGVVLLQDVPLSLRDKMVKVSQ
ncbi:hypothetical protein JZK55_10430 [Dissulfurispira thermophila]|uniref:PEGA domain-containing protein n=2 Tax=root TaxID=1 RepID=A0A7G1H1Z3_9BACT|nr:PEGA domain-containing protein [Dissulfurispira thermophila]BCB96121.1 hypothetical protein JZK55_10430 [Dissulfurispira thermophila]